jgi:hypothetical protein
MSNWYTGLWTYATLGMELMEQKMMSMRDNAGARAFRVTAGGNGEDSRRGAENRNNAANAADLERAGCL